MNAYHPEPLDNEERELAQRLARLGASGEPSSSLDAKILAAAHAAAAQRPASRLQRRPRWPVTFGVAASLALAVGVAWQLRPLPQASVYEEAESAAADAAATGGGPSADTAAVAPAPMMAPPSPAEPMESRASSVQKEADDLQAKSVAAGDDDVAGVAAAAPAPIVFDAAVPVAPASLPPPAPAPTATSATPEFVPAPPAPAASAPPMEQRTHTEQAARAPNMPARSAPAATPKPRDDAANDVLSEAAAAAEGSEEGFDERPPNTADAPEVRQAWLQRIRELIASGNTTAARDSLQEFKRRYPGVALPEDLRRFDRPL